MLNRNKILALSGSTRKNSSNDGLLKAIADLFPEELELIFYNGLAQLPQFNPDDDHENPHPLVLDFREKLRSSDGVIICTPEYAHGVPGALKNAIDWTVSSCEFSHKPTLLITASTDGQYGHQSLLETLRVIEAKNIDKLQLLIPFIKTKINAENEIRDEKTLEGVKLVVRELIREIRNKE